MAESDILSRVTGHYDRLRGQHVDVPEWGSEDEPLAVYFDPITAAQAQRLNKRANGNFARATALAVICHAKDADGKLLFEDNAATLAAFENNASPSVIARVGQAILGADEGTDEERADLGN